MLQLLSKPPSAQLALAGSDSGGVLEERVRKGLVVREMPVVSAVVTEGKSYTVWSSPVPLGLVLWVRAGKEAQREPHTGQGVSLLHLHPHLCSQEWSGGSCGQCWLQLPSFQR